ncbi:MAG: UDP-N-acetylglucosamine 2-epimerase [Bryobacterales bacterium]|nr:UDP-N-acetylglucosamine 2-epimerase [Bryobacterales bacterium]
MPRKIAVITTSRADYSHLYWVLRRITDHPELELSLIALGPHLAPEFGVTADEIEKDGFPLDARIECLLSSDTDVGMAKTIGLATLSLADHLGRTRPDLLLLIADRFEMLAPASVALALRIPMAHIEGGEISEGAIDDAVRNALTKLSHLHFSSTRTAADRVIAMGEEPWRVLCAGAPSLDHITHSTLKTREQLEGELGVDLKVPPVLIAYHPTTLALDTTREADAVFAALATLSQPLLFCYPNADAGSRSLIDRTRAFIASHPNANLFVNLNPISYWSLLRTSALLLGNSSSGVMEAASFSLPAVNIGIRQRGREHGLNVLNAAPTVESILQQLAVASSPDFRASLAGMINIYGDGHASERIVNVLATVPLGEELLIKRAAACTADFRRT